MNPKNAKTEIVRPDNEGNYLDNAGNLHRLFSEIAFFKYENRLPGCVTFVTYSRPGKTIGGDC